MHDGDASLFSSYFRGYLGLLWKKSIRILFLKENGFFSRIFLLFFSEIAMGVTRYKNFYKNLTRLFVSLNNTLKYMFMLLNGFSV